MRMAGCQPPMGRVKVDGLPLCDNMTMLKNHADNTWYTTEYGREWLINSTKCLMPCSFMEYKVKFIAQVEKALLLCLLLQVAEKVETHIPVLQMLVPLFSSNSILVRKEQEAFPFASLVADCGGILGLFVGFNFLMVWEWIMDLLLIIVHKVIKKRK